MKPRRTPCPAPQAPPCAAPPPPPPPAVKATTGPPTPTPAAPQAPPCPAPPSDTPQIERLRIPPAKTPTPCPAKAPPCPAKPPPSLPLAECSTCQFFKGTDEFWGGICRKLPPTINGSPPCMAYWWCGAYEKLSSIPGPVRPPLTNRPGRAAPGSRPGGSEPPSERR